MSGQWLFVCNCRAGLEAFDNSDASNLSVQEQLPEVDCYDLIAKDSTSYISTTDKLLQYDYSSLPLTMISELQTGS